MSVKTISANDLRRMEGKEGLILQGCGGSLDEWVDGINDMLTEDGILKDGTRFHDCSTFEHDGRTCLLFPFTDDVKIDVGKLAVWRLQTHENFGGIWLSDYVPNKLGGFYPKEQTDSVKTVTYDEFERQIEQIIKDTDTVDIYVSPDFQCDQTGGFPTSLCVCWDKGKAWLCLNESLIGDGEDVSEYKQLCADFGIRKCEDTEDFNRLLRGLGEDAYESAYIPDEDEDEGMEMGL